MATTFTKVDRGWYATVDGTFAVIVDGYSPSKSVGADSHYEGFTGGEWALAHDPNGKLRENHNAGSNVDWFPTKREAIAAYHARHAKG